MKSKIYIKYKDGILDPQGTVTNKALKSIGMKNIDSISIGKFIEINFTFLSLVLGEKSIDFSDFFSVTESLAGKSKFSSKSSIGLLILVSI